MRLTTTGGDLIGPSHAARTIAALLTLRDRVTAPILAGVRSPRKGRKPKTWTAVDRDYEQIRINMQILFSHLGIITTTTSTSPAPLPPHRQQFVDR